MTSGLTNYQQFNKTARIMEKKIFASVALACCFAGASAQTAPADSTRAEANVNAADSTREAVSLDSVSRQMELAGVTVKGSRKTTRADRDTYTFTEEQVEKAQHAADLVATLRDVHVDPVSSRLKMMDGGKVMLLLNGACQQGNKGGAICCATGQICWHGNGGRHNHQAP